MHFNQKNSNKSIIENRLTLLDSVKIDDHSRLTFTKRIREIFTVKVNDLVIAYYDNMDKYNKLIFKIQRDDKIIDTWILKREIINCKNKIETKLKDNDEVKNKITTHNKNTINILLVEDEEDLLFTFKKILIDGGYNIKAFSDSKNALYHLIETYKINRNHYDLIITDIRMPNINGIQLYQILTILEPESKILFITGLDSMDEIHSLVSSIKPQNVLKKPFGKEHLLQKINDIFSS